MGTGKTLFVDLGGVFLTNGWDRHSRRQAAAAFSLDYQKMEARHNLVVATHEIGKMALKDYLEFVIFDEERPFLPCEFREFMFEQSQPFPEMLCWIKQLKEEFGLPIVAISNEGRELTDYRVEKYHLKSFIDIFVCSGYVGLRKPDCAIYKLAQDLSQTAPENSLYIDDRQLFVEIAEQLGIPSICHAELASTDQLVRDRLLPKNRIYSYSCY